MTKFVVLTMHDKEKSYNQLIDITLPNKQEYCDKYNHQLIVKELESVNKPYTLVDKFLEIRSDIKLKFLKETISQNKGSWICWIDSDAIIMNMTITLDSFIDDRFDFIIGEDWNGINAGVFFLRANDAAIQFLDACIDYETTFFDKNYTPFWWWTSEQCRYTRNLNLVNTCIVHHSLFNGYLIGPRPDNDWRWTTLKPFNPNWQERRFQNGDFIVHLVGDYLEGKLDNARQLSTQIVR